MGSIVPLNATGRFPVAVNQERSFDFSTLAVDGGDVVLVHGFAVTQIADANALQDDFTGLLLG